MIIIFRGRIDGFAREMSPRLVCTSPLGSRTSKKSNAFTVLPFYRECQLHEVFSGH